MEGLVLSIVLITIGFMVFQYFYPVHSNDKLQELSNVQIRFKVSTKSSICIVDKSKKTYMLVYPINDREAKIKVPRSGIEGIHRCKVSLVFEIMDLVETHKVEVYDGENFIASSKIY